MNTQPKILSTHNKTLCLAEADRFPQASPSRPPTPVALISATDRPTDARLFLIERVGSILSILSFSFPFFFLSSDLDAMILLFTLASFFFFFMTTSRILNGRRTGGRASSAASAAGEYMYTRSISSTTFPSFRFECPSPGAVAAMEEKKIKSSSRLGWRGNVLKKIKGKEKKKKTAARRRERERI